MASRAVGATLDAAGPARVEDTSLMTLRHARRASSRGYHSTSFCLLRTVSFAAHRMLQAGEREQMRAFVVTSAGMGEGKTLTALNLAWLLAQTEGVRALVIDSDLRQPCATDYLASTRRAVFRKYWAEN